MADDNQDLQEKVIDKNIEAVMHSSMMQYSEHVILDRSLPRVEDGLKPVQRRILYSMHELGLMADKEYVKSARVVGDCLGKYHPHGDSSVYEAMVRMAQTFSQSVILVNGQGNFGSIDGDPAAAMRYTEVKMAPIAEEMIRDLDRDTVEWISNFDDKLKEPMTLPSRFPNLLVNGASGIAVGLATNIPPHNICETIDGAIALIKNPKISLDEMMKYIKAPDFPTGGIIVDTSELEKAYATGRGIIKLRAKIAIEKNGDKKSIIVTELPYQVNKTKLVQRIDRLRELKKDTCGNIADIIDESDRSGMRIVIKIKREGDVSKILDELLSSSDLERSVGINMVVIAEDKPQQLGIIDLLRHYVEYQRKVIYRRTNYDLSAAKAREHILKGLLIAVENIDEVIKIIRSSNTVTESKQRLRDRFELSEKQAQAILDMRLAKLNKLEVTTLKNELKELAELIANYSEIVSSKAMQFNIVREELLQVRRKYKMDRRTAILGDGEEAKVNELDLNFVEEKKGIAVLTVGKNIKFMTNKAYSLANKNCEDVNDTIISCIEANNSYPILAFTNMANCYRISVDDLSPDKWRHKGTSLSKLCELQFGEDIIAIFNKAQLEENNILFMTKFGMIKVSAGSEYLIDKKSFQALNLKNEDDRVISVEIKDNDKSIFAVSGEGLCINMESDAPIQGRRSMGVIGMALNDGDSVISAEQIGEDGEIVIITEKGYAKRIIVASSLKLSKRNRKGIKIQDLNPKTGERIVYSGYVELAYDIALTGEHSGVYVVNTEDIPIENTISKGKLLKNLAGNIFNAYKHNIVDFKAKIVTSVEE